MQNSGQDTLTADPGGVWLVLGRIVRVCMLSHFSGVQIFVTPWTIACQAPLSMGFSRQEYWNGLPYPPPGHLSDPRIKPVSSVAPELQVNSLLLSHWGSPGRY